MNRRVPVLCLLVSLFLSIPAFAGFTKAQEFRPATAEERAMTSVPSAPGAEAAILDWVRIDNDKESETTEYVRIKILTDEGKKYGDIELTYAPGYPLWGSVKDITARTIRPDGTIVPFAGKIYEKTIVKVGRNAVRAKTFSLPDVQPGSIIEYRYRRQWTDQLVFNTLWSVQRDIPVLHAAFTLYPYTEGDFNSMFTFVGLPAGKSPQKVGRDHYELTLENMPALRSEEFAPSDDQLRAHVNFFYLASNVKPDKFWEEQPKFFQKEADQFIGKSKTAAEVAKKLTAENPDRTALLQKIYAHVQSLRNLSYEAEKSAQEIKRQDIAASKNVEEVLRKGSGFDYELTRAFVAIARQAGFNADVMRTATRDEIFFSDKFPDAHQMDEEIAVVDVDGKSVYLDPGTAMAPYGVVSWEKTAVKGIRLVREGKPVWGDTAAQDPALAVTRRVANLKLEDDTLTGNIEVTFTGQEALVRRLRSVSEDEAARKKAIEDEIKTWFPDGTTLTLKSLTGDNGIDPNLVASYDITIPNAVSRAGSRVVVPLSIFRTTAKNPFAPATRTHVIYFPYSHQQEDVVKLAVPAGMTAATLPAPTDLKGGVLGYTANTTRKDGEITYTRTSNVNVMFVPVENYGRLRNFFNAVATADQAQVVLTADKGATK